MNDTQTGGLGSDAATAQGARPRVPPRRKRSAPPRGPGVRRARARYPQRALRFVTGGALMIAFAAAAFGAEGLMQASRSQSRLSALQANLASLQLRVGADEQAMASDRLLMRSILARARAAQRALQRVNWQLQSLPNEAQVAQLRGELATYTGCAAQLHNEVTGLGINWRVEPANPAADYFKLSTVAPISASCAMVLAGR
jgi:hypothetical protein